MSNSEQEQDALDDCRCFCGHCELVNALRVRVGPKKGLTDYVPFLRSCYVHEPIRRLIEATVRDVRPKLVSFLVVGLRLLFEALFKRGN